MPEIEMRGLPKLLEKLDFLPIFAQGMEAAGLWVKDYMADYPPVRRGEQPFKTPKQKRFFFWAVENNIIDVPWRRGMSPDTESLADAWTVELRDNGREVVVGNDTSYGPWVQDEDSPQSYYHKETGWRTKQDVINKEGPRICEVILEKINQHIKQV